MLASRTTCGWTGSSLHALGRAASGTQCACQIPLRASSAWELLVTLCLCLCAVAACDGCSASRLRYHALDLHALFVVLVAAVYGVVALQEVATSMSACTITKETEERGDEMALLTVERSSCGRYNI